MKQQNAAAPYGQPPSRPGLNIVQARSSAIEKRPAPPVYKPGVPAQTLQRRTAQNAPRPAAISGRGSSPQVIQPLIIRIRDVSEMVGISKPTIMNASKDIKKDVPKADVQAQEDVGITEATSGSHRQLGATEILIIVSHGSYPTVPTLLSSGIPTLGGYKPADLAAKIAALFPANYNGMIYLDGCYTGRRLNFEEGTSYIELFAAALKKTRTDISFRVKGNIGAAATGSDGVEYITLTKEEADMAKAKNWTVYEQDKNGQTIYRVASPFGIALCNDTGDYTDRGLSEQARAKAEAAKRQAEIDRMADAMSSLSPTMTKAEEDRAWNDML